MQRWTNIRNLQPTESQRTGSLCGLCDCQTLWDRCIRIQSGYIAQAQRNECGKKDPQELRDFLNDVRQASYSIRNHIERNFGAKEQEYITDEFAIGDPVKIPETKDEKPSEKASGKEKKAKNQPER